MSGVSLAAETEVVTSSINNTHKIPEFFIILSNYLYFLYIVENCNLKLVNFIISQVFNLQILFILSDIYYKYIKLRFLILIFLNALFISE